MDKKGKTLLLNTLLLFFCVVVIVVFSLMPVNLKEGVLNSYKINFDTAGGNEIAAVVIEEGKVVKEPDIPIREGYVFEGWYIGDEPFDFTKELSKDVTLTAKWSEKKPDIIYFTVMYDTDGGSLIGTQSVVSGGVATKPIAPSKDGFIFKEWQLNGVAYDFNTPVKSDITLVAVWEVSQVKPEEPTEPEEPKEKTYTIKFNLDGGTLKGLKSQTLKEGEVAKQPAGTPTKKGYTFDGWYLGNSVYKFGSPVTKSITIKAKWKANIYKVKIYSSSSSLCQTLSLPYNSAISIPSSCNNPTSAGYTFKGWSTSPSSTSGKAISNFKVTGDMSIYPAFSKIQYLAYCTPVGDAMTKIMCTPYITADGKKIDATIYVNGSVMTVYNISRWNALKTVTFDYNGMKGLTATVKPAN